MHLAQVLVERFFDIAIYFDDFNNFNTAKHRWTAFVLILLINEIHYNPDLNKIVH